MELLAPAGNFECLKAAVQNGADAVYFAGKFFGARSFANNFDEKELEAAVDYCHLRGAAAHITVNTLVADREMRELRKYVGFLSKIGADAVIVQDLGVMAIIRETCPELPIHASTQMTIHNTAGVLQVQELGASRVVLARELSKAEIARIAAQTEIELEVFAHGAMCMSYSGQCLMSSMIGGRSGNRGKCAQPCRLPYQINGSREKKFFLSLKDMSLLSHLTELKDIGVASLKIEGRMKGPAYVAAVVGIYRHCLDDNVLPTENELNLLDSVFFRGGYTDGYFTGAAGRKMFAFDKPDNPYKNGNEKVVRELAKTYQETEKRKRKCTGELWVSKGAPPRIVWKTECCSTDFTGAVPVQEAQRIALTEESIKTQLCKTGGTVFTVSDLKIHLQEGCFLSAKDLNELRRDSLAKLENKILSGFKRAGCRNFFSGSRGSQKADEVRKTVSFHCSVRTMEQLKRVREFPFERIGVPLSLFQKHKDELKGFAEQIIIDPPVILKESRFAKCRNSLNELYQEGFRSIYIHNLGTAGDPCAFERFASFRMNVFNRISVRELQRLGFAGITASPELNLAQLSEISEEFPLIVIGYGRLPLMITENCIVRNHEKCPCRKEENTMTDRMEIRFPIVKDDDSCRSVVLNSKPVYMADKMQDLKRARLSAVHLMFTVESGQECAAVCREYFEKPTGYVSDYTRAHFYKGVLT